MRSCFRHYCRLEREGGVRYEPVMVVSVSKVVGDGID